jgi:(2Fe-2S) ferredoxin
MGKHDRDRVVDVEKLGRSRQPCLGICADKDCARAGAKHIIRAAHEALEAAGLSEAVPVMLTKCQDYCDDSPSLTVFPGGYPYIDLEPEDVAEIVAKHVAAGQPVLDLLHKRMRKRLKRHGQPA